MALVCGCAAARQPATAVEPAQVLTILPANLEPVPELSRSRAERLELLHKALIGNGDPHDVILEVARLRDPSSVPFLIEALAKMGNVPREGPYGGIDTRFHCLDALQLITNHDAGRNADDWSNWYDANRSKTQQQWILEGFARQAFPLANVEDEAFITALIRSSDPKYQPAYIRKNALQLLTTLQGDAVVRITRTVAASSNVADRRAAVAALEGVTDEGRLDILRTLTGDADIDVAENALRTLNAALRVAWSAIDTAPIWSVRLANAGVHILNVLDARTVVLGIGYGIVDAPRVVGFDLVSQTVIWKYDTREGTRENAVRVGDRLYFVSDDRIIHCISIDGKPRWAKPLSSNPDRWTGGPKITAVGDRLFVPDGNSIYVVTLSGEIQSYPMNESVSRDLVRTRHHVIAAIHNGPLLVFDGTDAPKQFPTGLKTAAVSANDEAFCVVSFGLPYRLACFEEETLRELWRAELPNELGAYKDFQQDHDAIYVFGQGRALAFDIASGRRLWATNESRSGNFFKIAGRAALTRNGNFRLEWRDRSTGEVIATYGERRHTWFASDAAIIGDTVVAETRDRDQGDGLCLLPLPVIIKQRLTP